MTGTIVDNPAKVLDNSQNWFLWIKLSTKSDWEMESAISDKTCNLSRLAFSYPSCWDFTLNQSGVAAM